MIERFALRFGSEFQRVDEVALQSICASFPVIPLSLKKHWSVLGRQIDRPEIYGFGILRYFRLLGAGDTLGFIDSHRNSRVCHDSFNGLLSYFIPFGQGLGYLGVVVKSESNLFGSVLEVDVVDRRYVVHSLSVEDYLSSMYAVALSRGSLEPYEVERAYSRREYLAFSAWRSFVGPSKYREACWVF